MRLLFLITLRTMIKNAFDKSVSLIWLPTPDELEALTQDQLPEELLKFLNVVFSAREPKSDEESMNQNQ